ncbi:hypothetical protein NDU88_001480 [Pleurodeles waltl]|uniref:Uncharacterized protein n=1 Tax=Pleurodeles waltl TaxID=8319 RepID=A0AAV7USW7_PLEWA|nr:hypothetical protein NDU88_001480 [Pleurodeles waltl]
MPLPSIDIEEFQNTNEDGTEDMGVAIVEEGICKGITRDEWNTERNLDEDYIQCLSSFCFYCKERRYVVLVICNAHLSRLPRARILHALRGIRERCTERRLGAD